MPVLPGVPIRTRRQIGVGVRGVRGRKCGAFSGGGIMNNERHDDDELAQLSAIHAAIHAYVRYQMESGARDMRRAPDGLVALGADDCENFAIDDMFRVIKAGMPVEARLGYCWRRDGQMHMVCLVYSIGTKADPWILDIAADSVCRLSERLDLKLIYELGLDGIYVDGDLVGGVGNNALWASVLDRVMWDDMLEIMG